LFTRLWSATNEPAIGCVLIVHGMGEHGGRYARLADALNSAGYHVLAPDLRGHGRSLFEHSSSGDMGYDGWQRSLLDIRYLQRWLYSTYHLPTILLGHSMGAMLSQQYLGYFGHSLAACVLSGSTGAMPTPLTLCAQTLAGLDSWRYGPHAQSPLLKDRLFAANNQRFEKLPDEVQQQGFNWLSRDRDQVDAYISDPMCGAVLSAGSLADMFAGLRRGCRKSHIACIPKGLPIRFVSGTADPVNANGRGIERLRRRYEKAQLNVSTKLYPEGRHEMFNETNCQQVFADLLTWLEEVDFA
jgi:alpha-beta hydrolase superfamily lysophospholipase